MIKAGGGEREEEVEGGFRDECKCVGDKSVGEGCWLSPGSQREGTERTDPAYLAPHPAALTCKGFWGRVELALRQSTGEQQRSTGNSSLGSKIPCRRRHGQPLSQTRVSSFRLILALREADEVAKGAQTN